MAFTLVDVILAGGQRSFHQFASVAPVALSATPSDFKFEPELVETGHRSRKFSVRAGDVWKQRELLGSLTKREVKSRHKNSVLGMFWNLLNPLLHLSIFSIVFTYFLPSGFPNYPLKLLSGLIVYHLFTFSIMSGATSVTSNAALIKKIWFPREVLPIASVGANLITFASRMAIMCTGLALMGQSPEWGMLWLLIPAVLITILLALGAGMLLAALNVFYRDVQHFLEMALLALFWFTPIVYAYDFVANTITARFGPSWERLAMLNPLTPIVVTFQRVLYNPTNFSAQEQEKFALLLRPTSWYVQNLAYSAAVGVVLLWVGMRVFSRLEGDFAERL